MTDLPTMFVSARLLLIDDDSSFLQVLSRILRDYPNQRFATSGVDGLRLAREAKPDLILLDVEMPGLGGLQFCRELKADPALADVPVIFITSAVRIRIAVAGFQAGGCDYVTKPVSRWKVLVAVETCLLQSPSFASCVPAL
jgi:CheY-like chemotaxis protein